MRKTVCCLPLTRCVPNKVGEGHWPLLLVINSDHLQWPLFAMTAFRRSFANCLMPLQWKRRPNCLTKTFKPTTAQTPDGEEWISRSRSIAFSFEIKRNVPLSPRPLSPEAVPIKCFAQSSGSFEGLHLGFVVFPFQNNLFRYLVKNTRNTCHSFGYRRILISQDRQKFNYFGKSWTANLTNRS